MAQKKKQPTWEDIEPKLKKADILLFHTKKGFIPPNVRKLTNSYWNHSALVFAGSDDLPFGRPLIVEAIEYGIEVRQIRKYADHQDVYDIGVLRYPGLTDEQREQLVQSFVLNYIDTPYDYGRLFAFYAFGFLRHFAPHVYRLVIKKMMHKNQFLCSTFVYKAFRFIKGYDQKLFNTMLDQNLMIEEHEFYTPGKIATNKEFKWIYNQHD